MNKKIACGVREKKKYARHVTLNKRRNHPDAGRFVPWRKSLGFRVEKENYDLFKLWSRKLGKRSDGDCADRLIAFAAEHGFSPSKQPPLPTIK